MTPSPQNSCGCRTVEELRLDTEELVVSRLLGDLWPFCGDTWSGDAGDFSGFSGPWKCKVQRGQ